MIKKTLRGRIVRINEKKTVFVKVFKMKTNRKYKKTICLSKNYMVNVSKEIVNVGDNVLIVENKPISKFKKWNLK